MKVKNWKVYVHINKINKKRYYGITSQKINRRWRKGKGYPENEHFTNAINKYGWDNFEHIVIARGLTEEEAKWLEIELIREFDTTNRDKGYNQTLGGDGTVGYHHTEETKKKRSERMSGENNPNYGKHLSEETKKKLSEANKGKKATEEAKQKNREAHLGKNNSQATSVICLTTKKIFHTATEGAEKYNASRGNISTCCKGYRMRKGKKEKVKSCGKLPNGTPLVWRYIKWNHGKTYRIVRNKEVV